MVSWEHDASKANNHESNVTQALMITEPSAKNKKGFFLLSLSLSLMLGLLHK
jgi:hypothetical protein